VSTHVHEELGAYVFDALSEHERDAVRAHLERCPECRARHAEIADLPALLDLAAVSGKHDLVPLAPAVEERVLDRFAREVGEAWPHRSRRLRRLPRRWLFLGGGALASAAVAALLLVLVVGGGGGKPAGYQLMLHGTGAVPKAGARAGLQPIAGGTRVRLSVWDLPGDPAAVYEVRCEAPGWSASAGTFHVDRQGRAYVVLTTAAREGEYEYVRVVRRDRDASGRLRVANVLSGRLS
jgi:Putative zinc-finger